MIVIITDDIDTKEYSFVLTVVNKPPVFLSEFAIPPLLIFGEIYNYTLPSSNDPEGLNYTTTI